MSWYPEGATLCPRCYGVMTHVYKDEDRSIYMCEKCGKETSVKLEEKETI